jgi:hypothetical protein
MASVAQIATPDRHLNGRARQWPCWLSCPALAQRRLDGRWSLVPSHDDGGSNPVDVS